MSMHPQPIASPGQDYGYRNSEPESGERCEQHMKHPDQPADYDCG
jgi:hypothetical protein